MNEVITGDCLSTLRFMSPESVDLLVTDPPYGYSFMGRDWDKAVPSVDVWKECLRVLKPGAFAFVMSAPRQDVLSQMIVRLGMAGFDTSFTSIYWTYASGFPKAANVGKLVDKRNGKSRDGGELAQYIKQKRQDAKVTLEQVNEWLGAKLKAQHYESLNQDFNRIPVKTDYIIIKEKLQLDNRFDELIEREEAEREVIARQKMTFGIGGSSERMGNEKVIDLPATPQAKTLEGSYAGFQPKPAVEVIIVAMKPLSEKTYVDQELSNGKGITWLDDARIPYQEKDKTGFRPNCYGKEYPSVKDKFMGGFCANIGEQNPKGRFPANLLCQDDVLNDGRITKSSGGSGEATNKAIWQKAFALDDKEVKGRAGLGGYGDSGSYSRYFDLDRWAEKTLPFLIVPKASKSEKDKGLEDMPEKESPRTNLHSSESFVRMENGQVTNRGTETKSKNFHPTVKPLKLMSYLITMGSRQGDVILDPFCGSGTTCVAAKQLGRQYIGLELSDEYATIARKRIDSITSLSCF